MSQQSITPPEVSYSDSEIVPPEATYSDSEIVPPEVTYSDSEIVPPEVSYSDSQPSESSGEFVYYDNSESPPNSQDDPTFEYSGRVSEGRRPFTRSIGPVLDVDYERMLDEILDEKRELAQQRRELREEREALRAERADLERDKQRFRKRVDELHTVEDRQMQLAERLDDDDDHTRPLPDAVLQELDEEPEELDDEIVIGDEEENIIEDNRRNFDDQRIIGTRIYNIDSNNADQVYYYLNEEARQMDVSNGMPLYLMVRVRNHLNPKRIRYFGLRYTENNLYFLINTVKEPWDAWFYYRDSMLNEDSDVANILQKKFDIEDNITSWWEVTHVGFYKADAQLLNNLDISRDIRREIDQRNLRDLFTLFPNDLFANPELVDGEPVLKKGTKRTRVGRFMPYQFNFEFYNQNRDNYLCKFWASISANQYCDKEFQIPWFSISSELFLEADSGEQPLVHEIYSIPCFLYALKSSLTEEEYKMVASMKEIHGFGVKLHTFSKIQEMGIKKRFKVYRICNTNDGFKVNYDYYPKSIKACEGWPEIKLCFWENHYMTYKEFEIEKQPGKKVNTSILRLLEESKRIGLLKPYNGYDFAKLYQNYAYDQMIHFNDKLFIKNTSNNSLFDECSWDKPTYKEKQFQSTVWFADFEATTDEIFHKPYLIVAQRMKITLVNNKFHYEIERHKCFWGENCAKNFLQCLAEIEGTDSKAKRPQCRVYFYNLKYDFTFILSHLTKVHKTVKGGKLYSATGYYKNFVVKKQVYVDFWDALPIFSCSLKKATGFYLTEEQKKTIRKEIFPYDLYTYEFFDQHPDNLCSTISFLSALSDEDRQEIQNNEYFKLCNDEISYKFDYKQYATFYCIQDVNCLRQIMINFANLLWGEGLEGIQGNPPFHMNLWKYRTASSIGFDYFQKTVMFIEQGGEQVPRHDWAIPKCALRALIQMTIRGGRVMIRDNKSIYFKSPKNNIYLVDYDGVSLYPSAMSLLWLTEGPPRFIKREENEDKFNETDVRHMFASPDAGEEEASNKEYKDGIIHLTKIKTNINLHFPMLCLKDKKTKLNNYRNFPEWEDVDTWVNIIDIYNLLDFQQAEIRFDAAVVWEGQRHYEIRESIEKLFNFRKNNKKHPIQLVTKLMMNSIFGKSILKVTDKEKQTIDKIRYRKNQDNKWEKVDNWAEFFRANTYRIHKFEDVGEQVEVELLKRDISSSFNIFGSNVLAMARRIIGRVMSTAEEVEREHPEMSPGLFYTDTDSMHIRNDLLELTEIRFYEKYRYDIKGSDLCQFHIDFDNPKNFEEGEEVIGAIESYFNMKKIYADKLIGTKGSIGYHLRMKGIPTDLVKYEQYKDIYEGRSVKFDLLNGHIRFYYENGHVKTRHEMTREIMLPSVRQAKRLKK